MAAPKTKRTNASVKAFIDAVENETRRSDAKVIAKMMQEITGEKPYMLGPTIIGYGSHEGPTGTWPIAAFSPRKANMVVYLMPEFDQYAALLKKLGKHKTGKSCLYIGPLATIDADVLRAMVERSVARMRAKYG